MLGINEMTGGLGSSGAGFVHVEVARTAPVSETITFFSTAIASVAVTILEAQGVLPMAEMSILQLSRPPFLPRHAAISNRLRPTDSDVTYKLTSKQTNII